MGLFDSLIPIIFLFFVAITIPVFYMFFDQVETTMTAANTELEIPVDITAITLFKESLLIFDIGILFFLAGSLIASFLSTYLIRSLPWMLIPALFLFIINIAIAAFFTNIYSTFLTSNVLIAAAADNFPITVTIINNLPVINLVAMSLGAIFLFGKTPNATATGEF